MSSRDGNRAAEPHSDIMDSHAAALYLGAHVETIRRLARRGGIPSFKVGKDWRFSRAALSDWIQSHPLASPHPLVLIIDDERSFRRTVAIGLEAGRYRVMSAETGEEGIELARHDRPDLVILDLSMPGLTGGRTLKQLRLLYPALPVIVTTGYPDGDLMQEALEASPFTLLAKPVPIKTLLAVIEGMVEGSRPR